MTNALRAVIPASDPGVFASRPLAAGLSWLTELQSTPDGGRLVAASSGGLISRATAVIGRGAVQWAVEVGHDVASRVATEIPGHVADDGFDVLRMGTESATLQLLLALSGVELEAAATSESLAGVPEFVRRRVGLDAMLRGIQLGHSVIAAAFLTECARVGDPVRRPEQMRILSERMFLFFDVFSTEMAAFYRDEERRWTQSDAVERLTLVTEVLRGTGPVAPSVERRLRYTLGRSHVALVMWSSARTIDADPAALHEAACDLIRRIGCEQKLLLEAGPAVSWAWITPQPGSGWAERLAGAALPPATHVVFSGEATGASGFRSSHLDAVAAFGMLAREPSPAPVTAYRDVDLLSLLLADRARALRFARNELGALTDPGATMADIRQTLAAYLDTGCSPQAVAERLGISRNTVTYRVRRAEELLGRPVRARHIHLRVALAVHEEAMRAER